MASVRRSARLSGVSGSPAPDVPGPAAKATKATEAAAAAPAVSASAAARKRKTAAAASEPASVRQDDGLPLRPSTPPPKKRRGRPAAAEPAPRPDPPATPTTPRPRHPAVRRLANPDLTNVPLISPETSRIVSLRPPLLDSSLDMPSTPTSGPRQQQPRTTTDSLLEEACAHLIRVEPRLKPVIEAKYCEVFSPDALAKPVDPFESLASGIISQQVSGAAARAIKARFVALFEDRREPDATAAAAGDSKPPFPHPSQVAVMGVDKLRSAGLSQRKAEYLRGLAEKFVSGELSAQLLAEAPYDTLVERLVAVRGLGLWSVEMFAMFGLKRLDVFSVGDLGVQRGMAAFAGRDIAKLKRAGSSSSTAKKNAKWKYMAEAEMLAMAEPFRPYRSVFMWYMWQVESVDVSTMG